MPARGIIEKNNFTAGELSPLLHNRTDNERYNNGVATLRNFVVLSEGGVTRRPGTRFVLAAKSEAQAGVLVPFRYTGADSYMLVLNGGAIRFLRAGGFIESSPGVPYEVAMPWAGGDVLNVRWAQEGNAAWLPCAGYEPRKLTRNTSHTDWTLSLYRPTGGPVKPQNLDTNKTILASATTGSISLLGVGTSFQAGHVNSVWRLDESDLSLIANWKANEAIVVPTTNFTATAAGNIGDFTTPANAFDANNATMATHGAAADGYVGRNWAVAQTLFYVTFRCDPTFDFYSTGAFGPATVELYGKNGAPANSTDGTKLGTLGFNSASHPGTEDRVIYSSSGTASFTHYWLRAIPAGAVAFNFAEIIFTQSNPGASGILRRYNGNVYQALSGTNSGLTPPTHTEGDVLSETGGMVWRYRHGPYGFVRITAVTDATHATADVLKVLPDSVVLRPTYRWFEGAWSGVDGWPEGVLLIDRGLLFWRGRDFWMTTVDADNDFEVTVLPDSAIAQSLRSRDGSLPTIQWALDNGVIVLGCRDNEVLLRAPATFEPLTGTNIRAPIASKKGSAAQVPAALESGVIFISRSRKRLFYASFDPDSQKLEPVEVSIASKHLLKNQARGLGWQPDPLSVLWGYDSAGVLFGLTFNVEHKIAGMHQHRMTGQCAVTDVKSIPSSDEGVSDVYLIVVRVINGTPRTYIEQLGAYFNDSGSGNAAGAWFFDCALSYSGPAVTTISGLTHLIGQEVGILANNAVHARKTVSPGGTVTLDYAATSAVIGLPIDARVVDLPRDLAIPGGTTRGQRKRATHCNVELVETIGGTIATNGGKPEQLELTGALAYGAPPALFTGMKRKQLRGPLGDEASLEIIASDGMPLTLIGLAPDLDVTED